MSYLSGGGLRKSRLKQFAVAALLSISMQTFSFADTSPLPDYRWKNRLLLIFATSESDPDVVTAREALAAAACDVTDRDLVIGWIWRDGQSSLDTRAMSEKSVRALRSRLGITGDGFAAVLIGKDGGVKARYPDAPDLKEIFSLIDGMPMRRAEQRAKGSPCDDG